MDMKSSFTWQHALCLGTMVSVIVTFACAPHRSAMWTQPAKTLNSFETSLVPRFANPHGSLYPRVFHVPQEDVSPQEDNQVPVLHGKRSPPSTPLRLLSMVSIAIATFSALVAVKFSRWQNKRLPGLLQPLMIATVGTTFDMKGPAECLTLWQTEGYAILDLRSEMERSEGRIRGLHPVREIPMFTLITAYDTVLGRMVMRQEVNPEWLDVMKSRFPNPNAKLIVMCSDGNNRTRQALDLLYDAGYRYMVGMSGGYRKWDQLFDLKQRSRNSQSQNDRVNNLVDPIQWGRWDGLAQPAASSTPGVSVSPARPRAAARPLSFPIVEYASHLDPAFQAATIAAFPAAAVATVPEARVLWKLDGYIMLDIRSDLEGQKGRIHGPNKRSLDIPMFQARSQYDAILGKEVVTQEANQDWLKQVTERLPTKSAKIIVVCSDGGNRSSQALDLLTAAGYPNLVLMQGGYNRWDQIFDQQLQLRTPQQQAAKVDWVADPVEWVSWTTAVGMAAPPQRQSSLAETAAASTPIALFQDPAFQAATISAFPAKAVANVQEARVLWKLDNYSLLDVRSETEGREGRIRGPTKRSVDIPLFNIKVTYDSSAERKVVKQEVTADWLERVKERFPKDAKIVVVCSDGTNRSAQALRLLAANGYKNLVLMEGGYNKWDQVFDKQLQLRSPEQQSAKAYWLRDPVEWMQWTASVGLAAPATTSEAPKGFPMDLPGTSSSDVTIVGQFQNPAFQGRTIASFPAKGDASVEEARVLWKQDGYSLVDLRSEMEGINGRIRGANKGSIDMPMFTCKATLDSSSGQRVVQSEPNPLWLSDMKARFPIDSKLILMCSDGGIRSSQARRLLAAEGYQKLVVMVGGYNKWDQLFDNRLALRAPDAQRRKSESLKDEVQWGSWA